jgi:hypothetical protein
MSTRCLEFAGAVLALSVSAFSLGAAQAAGVTLIDNYDGGIDTWNGNGAASAGSYVYNKQSADIYAGQVIGDANIFSISSLTAQRVGTGGGVLEVVVNTAYAGQAGVDGTGYGALFITPGYNVWKPTGSAPYPTDQYVSGEWTYAATIPTKPGADSGSGGVFLTSGGDVVLSNVNGDFVTAPYNGNSGWDFRQGEAVQFDPGAGQSAAFTESWVIDPTAKTITFLINDNGALGDNFAISWAMTCANGIIEGQVNGVPELATWAMMLAGFAGLGFVGHRASRRSSAAAPA